MRTLVEIYIHILAYLNLTMKQALIYSLKIWLTTIVLSVSILSILIPYKIDCVYCNLKEYLWAILGAVMVFFPLLILIALTISIIIKKDFKAKHSKLFLGSILVILTIIYAAIVDFGIYLIDHVSFGLQSILFASAFPLMMGMSMWLYKFQIDDRPTIG